MRFGLFQTLPDPAAVFDRLAGRVIQAGAETRERLQFLELGVRELEVAGHRAIGGALCGAPDARDRLRDVHRGKDAEFE